MQRIFPFTRSSHQEAAVTALCSATYPVALTGAGISVPSGIPDFRSPGGLWSIFAPEEYATLDVFERHPEKAWKLYRELGRTIWGKEPNPAHSALAQLEQIGVLKAIITQNVDRLHQQAGSSQVIEMHGDHQHLHCLHCRFQVPVEEKHYQASSYVACPKCTFPLKPNVVLYGEDVREYRRIMAIARKTDLLLVIGTSAQVYPAADIPVLVKRQGGMVFEFNQEHALTNLLSSSRDSGVDYCFQGDVTDTLPWLVELVQAQ